MALTLEVRDPHGRTTWRRLDQLPITIGRAVSNDVIVDDPYTDAVHARIELDEQGALVIVDNGSLNGLVVNGTRAAGTVQLTPGRDLRLGRTMLRLRDGEEPIPPALRMDSGAKHWLVHTARGRGAVIGAAVGIAALNAWLASVDADTGINIFAGVMAVVVMLLIWSGIWSASARGADRRFNFAAHLAVASLIAVAMFVYSTISEWMAFLFPAAEFLSSLEGFVYLGALAWAVAAHLEVPHLLTPKRRWRTGLVVSGIALGLAMLATLLDTDDFTHIPEFQGQLKAVPASLVPTTTTEQFLTVMREVKGEADEAAKSTAAQDAPGS